MVARKNTQKFDRLDFEVRFYGYGENKKTGYTKDVRDTVKFTTTIDNLVGQLNKVYNNKVTELRKTQTIEKLEATAVVKLPGNYTKNVWHRNDIFW